MIASARRVFRLPRERSSLGILTFSFLLAVISALNFKLSLLTAASSSFLLFLLTFDFLFENSMKPLSASYLAALSLDAVPIAASIALRGFIVLEGLIPSLTCTALYLYLAAERKGRSVKGMVLGSSILAGLYFYFDSVLGSLSPFSIAVGFMLFIYNAAEVVYVESRLAFRKVSPKIPLAVFLASFLSLMYLPYYFAVPLLEPLFKNALNALRNEKISRYEEINELGLKEFIRYSVFFALLCSASLIYELKLL